VEIDAGNGPLNLVEADVIESFETGTAERAYTVVGDQELLLPPHEDILTLRQAWDLEVQLPGVLVVWAEGGKFGPVLEVYQVRRAPVWMLGEEGVFGANELSFKIGREGRVIVRQACLTQPTVSLRMQQ
jgi:hypothetical protein